MLRRSLGLPRCRHQGVVVVRGRGNRELRPVGDGSGARYGTIRSSAFPFTTNLVCYFAVTEGEGALPVRMELIDVDEERPAVFNAEGIFVFEHLRQVIEGMFAFSNLVIPEAGEYRLKLFIAGEFLMERSLHVAE